MMALTRGGVKDRTQWLLIEFCVALPLATS
jgi:hypothetical protein